MKKNPKIAVIGTVGLPANYGGFETLVEHLVDELAGDYEFSIYCSKKKYPKQKRQPLYKGARLIYLPFDANGMQSIIYDTISIIHAMFFADVLVVLGVSGCFTLPFVRLFSKKKIITSIDGIEWKRGKWSKLARLYLWAAEWMAVKFSHVNIADNESIQDYTAIRYGMLSNIIEYGADHTMQIKPGHADKEKYPFLKNPYAFKVCRIEPENNISMVLKAFSELPKHQLVIVGNWQNSEYGKNLFEQYQHAPNIKLLNPIYNQTELDVLRSNAFVYLHGHSAGGTNPALVEAMYLGLPVITYHVSYNKTTTEGKAFYFGSAEELKRRITEPSVIDFKNNAARMKEVANRRYTWKVIAHKYAHLMNTVLQGKTKTSLKPQLSQKLEKESLFNLDLAHLSTPQFFYEKR